MTSQFSATVQKLKEAGPLTEASQNPMLITEQLKKKVKLKNFKLLTHTCKMLF